MTDRAAVIRKPGISVLHVLTPASEGGLEQVVTMLAAGNLAGVHVAAVVTPMEAENHPFVSRLESLGIAVTRVVVRGRSYMSEYRSLSKLVERLQPEVIHTHGYRADILAGAVAHTHGIPTVSTVHGFTGGGARNRFYERIQCLALRRADAVVAVSRPLVERLINSGVPNARIHCIQNGFAAPGRLLSTQVARERLGLPQKGLIAGWVGRLSREKGADVMLRALAESPLSWKLSIIGSGRERERLADLAARLGVEHRVFWHGAKANAATLLRAYDAFVISSRTEGTPISLLEAMYAAVPVVATRVGGIPDVVSDAHALLVSSESPRAIAEALIEIERNHPAARQRAVLARERVVQTFAPSSWLAAVDAVYRNACA